MRRAGVKIVHPRLLDDVTGIHDGDVVGEAGDHPEIVRDPDDRDSDSACSRVINSTICAWIVTSRAVVGSSAMINGSGEGASAIAIITRWRIPPEN